MKLNDKAYVVINSSQLNKTLAAFGHEEKIAKKILIIGGGNIGLNLAKNLEQTLENSRIKIIEKNKTRAEFIAGELENSLVINGDGLDEEVLKEANIEEVEICETEYTLFFTRVFIFKNINDNSLLKIITI